MQDRKESDAVAGNVAVSTYCTATLQDARLIKENLEVNTDVAEKFLRGSTARAREIVAPCEISNDVSVGWSDGGQPVILTIVCKLDAYINEKSTNANPLIKYSSHYTALFKVLDSSGLTKDGSLPMKAIVPYISQANWIAIRRADTCFAATGIANLRLRTPEVSQSGLEESPALVPVDQGLTRES